MLLDHQAVFCPWFQMHSVNFRKYLRFQEIVDQSLNKDKKNPQLSTRFIAIIVIAPLCPWLLKALFCGSASIQFFV
ncbi:hypothetical protein CWE17_06840 [Synechococcus sp. BS56D]|nr:hypothetical protein CWE17_06840 [Synechococcus sp. BS56D]